MSKEKKRIVELPSLINRYDSIASSYYGEGRINKHDAIGGEVHDSYYACLEKLNERFLQIGEQESITKVKEEYYEFLSDLEKKKIIEINKEDKDNWGIVPGEKAKEALNYYGSNKFESWLRKIIYNDPTILFQKTHDMALRAIEKEEKKEIK